MAQQQNKKKANHLAPCVLAALAATFVVLLLAGQARAAGAEVAAADADAAATAAQAPQEESYQRVYEAFSRLVQNVSNNSLGNARRLVSRLNQLVGGSTIATSVGQQQQVVVPVNRPITGPANEGGNREQSVDEKTEQLLTRLDNVNKNTDQNTLRQLNEDVNRFVGTLSESYLRNIRRLIERVNKVVGTSSPITATGGSPTAGAGATLVVLHQDQDSIRDPNKQPPGFPGWDELIVAVDRVQKSLANFVRSSTKLITSG